MALGGFIYWVFMVLPTSFFYFFIVRQAVDSLACYLGVYVLEYYPDLRRDASAMNDRIYVRQLLARIRISSFFFLLLANALKLNLLKN